MTTVCISFNPDYKDWSSYCSREVGQFLLTLLAEIDMETFYGPLSQSMQPRFLHLDSWDPTQGSPRVSAVPTHTCPSGQGPHMFPFSNATPAPLGVCFVWLLTMLTASGTSWTKQFHSLVFLIEEMSRGTTLPQRQTKERAVLYTGRVDTEISLCLHSHLCNAAALFCSPHWLLPIT